MIEWSQVDLERKLIRIEDDQTKDKETREIPLPQRLILMLERIEPKQGPPVFLARPTLPAFEVLEEVGGIDGAGFDRHARTELGGGEYRFRRRRRA